MKKNFVILSFFLTPLVFLGANYGLLATTDPLNQQKTSALQTLAEFKTFVAQAKQATNTATIQDLNTKAMGARNKFVVNVFAYLAGQKVTNAQAIKAQLDKDMNSLDKKYVEGYAPVTGLKLDALLADGSAVMTSYNKLNALARQATLTSDHIKEAQGYVGTVNNALSSKTLLDAQAHLEKIFAERIKKLAAEHATIAQAEVAPVHQRADAIIAQAQKVLNTVANASKADKDAAKAALKVAQNARGELVAAYQTLLNVVATKKASDKDGISKAIADAVAQDQLAQSAYNEANSRVGKIDAEVAKVKAARDATATALTTTQAATTLAAATAGLQDVTAKRKVTEGARDAADKAASLASSGLTTQEINDWKTIEGMSGNYLGGQVYRANKSLWDEAIAIRNAWSAELEKPSADGNLLRDLIIRMAQLVKTGHIMLAHGVPPIVETYASKQVKSWKWNP